MSNINLFALGGQDENGKNTFVIEVERDIYVVNTGIKFPLNDLWGVDGIIADNEYLKKHKNRIKGIFLTHANDEDFAALPWYLMDLEGVTVYGSKFTIDVAKKRVEKYHIEHSNYKLKVIGDSMDFGNVKVKTFSVATSIPGALAFNFQTKDGDIIFMSNFINDDLGVFGKTDLHKMAKESNNVLALITDSRRANYPKHAKLHKSLNEYAEKVFKRLSDDKRIIFGAFDEEMYNIFEIIELANKYNRPVAFYGSAFATLFTLLKKHDNSIVTPNKIIDYKNVNNVKNVVVLVTGTWSRLNDRFNRISEGKDVYLKFKKDDAVIMYTPPVNGMEVEYSVALDNITMITPDITSIDDKMVFPMRQAKADIADSVKILKPKYFVPIGSLFRYQKEACNAAVEHGVRNDRAIIVPNGKIIYLKDGELASRNGVVKPCGDVIIQGHGVGDISYEVLKERKTLSAGGLVAIAVKMDTKKKQLVGKINVQIVGVVVKEELKMFQEEVRNVVIQKFEQAEKINYREIQNTIRKRVQKIFMKRTNKEPLVVVTFYEI